MFTWELTLKQSEVRYLLITVVLIDVCLLNRLQKWNFHFLSDAATELHVSNSRLREIESINAALKLEVRTFETLLKVTFVSYKGEILHWSCLSWINLETGVTVVNVPLLFGDKPPLQLRGHICLLEYAQCASFHLLWTAASCDYSYLSCGLGLQE